MWKYSNNLVASIEDVPAGATGFIYEITDSTGKKYIGKKSLWSIRKKHFGKKKLATMTDKRLKTWEKIKKESDWLKYTGSNKELNRNIDNNLEITKEILIFAYSKKELTYLELKFLFSKGVLESDSYYNDNIQGKFFRKDLV